MTDSDRTNDVTRPNTHPADKPGRGIDAPALSNEDRRMARIGVGCFTTFIGTISGAMVGVLVAVGFTFGTRCEPLDGLPACNWHMFALGGAIIGGLTLPVLVLSRLRRRTRAGT